MLRDVIVIDEAKCDGCGDCVTACAEGAIQVIDGKARLVSEVYCDGLGACLGKCPQGAITVVKREAATFDEQAVHQHLRRLGRPLPPPAHAHAPGHVCPGSQQRSILTQKPTPAALAQTPTASQLGHWPVQLKLVNPAAPFLAGAEVLLTADCVPVALPDFHSRWVPGRVVVLACPKLDDLAAHTAKLTTILQVAKPRKVTVLRMEVPCCGGIAWAAKQAVDNAGTATPIEVVTIGIDGQPR
jgi:Pyruvate/2-oxoacid:ferredoxin oxidoreductase delta subunit